MDKLYQFESSSAYKPKGIWVKEDNIDYYVKADCKYNELEKENAIHRLSGFFGFESVEYTRVKAVYNGNIIDALKCKSFLGENERSISISELVYGGVYGRDWTDLFSTKSFAKYDRFIDTISQKTCLDSEFIKEYLLKLTIFDLIICNTDRTLYNISFIERDNKYRISPLYDSGLSFMLLNGYTLNLSDLYTRRIHYESGTRFCNCHLKMMPIVYPKEAKDILEQWSSIYDSIEKHWLQPVYRMITDYRMHYLLTGERVFNLSQYIDRSLYEIHGI